MFAPMSASDASPTTDNALPGDQTETLEDNKHKTKKGEKRRFFGLGKKKNEAEKEEDADRDIEQSKQPPSINTPYTPGSDTTPKPSAMRAVSPQRPIPIDARNAPASPQSIMSDSASPSRFRPASPRLHSPASSLIFERNVQENPLPDDLSHSIPSHIQTEDHIPAVLEATSIALTDGHLNPDEVEIVMHSAHQPAAVTIAHAAMSDSGALSPGDDIANNAMPENMDDNASTYGSIDPADHRRLSFISFADVVQSEHVEKEKDSMLHMSISSAANRSPSPVRSPVSPSGIGPSPPTSSTPSMKGVDTSTVVATHLPPRLPASPMSQASGTQSPPLGGGELMVETMRQALRKTGSGDLGGDASGSQSQPLSTVGADEPQVDHDAFKS